MIEEVEYWKDIKGYEGSYQVSSLGRVRSLDRIIKQESRWGNIVERRMKSHILSPGNCRGYHHVTLGKHHNSRSVHRLVADHFIPNPGDKPEVNHKDGVKTNNACSNLEWTTRSENMVHARDSFLVRHYGKRIIGRSPGKVVIFMSSREAERQGYNGSAIRNVINGGSRTHKGMTWEQVFHVINE